MLKPPSLPDDVRVWRGTAAQLAVRLSELLPMAGLEFDVGKVNERLIRYYVTTGILTGPEPHGRERLFGYTQIVEFLVARQLLKDGWPLAKIRELIRSSAGIEGLRLDPDTSRGRAADLALRRSNLRDGLKSLGNPSGRPHRRRVLKLSLTPWCQVLVDVQALESMDASTPQVLGDALACVLEEERLMPAEKE